MKKSVKQLFYTSALSSIFLFQNCGKVSLTDTTLQNASLNQSSVHSTDIQFKEVIIAVEVNQTKSLNLIENANFTGYVSLASNPNQAVLEYATEDGSIKLESPRSGKITFTPSFGFRGSMTVIVYAKYDDLKTEATKLTFEVQNPLRNFKPALVVRAAECLLCHASVKGDIISDFGFKSSIDPFSGDFFFIPHVDPGVQAIATRAYSVGHSVSDDPNASGWRTALINGNVVVPYAKIKNLSGPRVFPYSPQDTETLKDYVDKVVFADRATNPARAKAIVEKSKIYIGAPTADEIKTYGKLSDTKPLVFVKNEKSSPDLSGFSRFKSGNKDYYTNTADMICEGDIFVDGIVLLSNLRIKTDEGCRIHSTKTVFINGPIEYLEENALTNLQVMSAKAIYMGAGICIDCYQKFDSANADERRAAESEYGAVWPLTRAGNLHYWAGGLRGRTDLSQYSNEIGEDFLKVSNSVGVPARPEPSQITPAYYEVKLKAAGITMIDPGSRYLGPNNAKIDFRRLLLNAPDVQSRYSGNFQGTVIAEFALWRLGQFSFVFDPVFKAVPIFPLVDINKVIRIED